MAGTVQPENPPKPVNGATAARDRARVFINYSSPDASIAVEVCDALERNVEACWIAPRDVAPGEFYADAIVAAIDAASKTRQLVRLAYNITNRKNGI
jgi:hypothetical protein